MIAVGLTATQMTLFRFIEREIVEGRPPPSYDEMRAFMGLRSKSGINRLLKGLVERGRLVRLPNRVRAMALPGSPGEIAMRQAAIRDAQAKLDHVSGQLRIGLPPVLAGELLDFCDRERAIPSDVVVTALIQHMRGRP